MPSPAERFADKIENALKGHCNGFAFVVSHRDQKLLERQYGKARTNSDAPAMDMTADVPFHIASVSKTITAAALLKILRKRDDVHAGMAFHPWLPEHWHIHADIRGITFRQLLTHTSGLRTTEIDYHSLKKSMADGITIPPDKPYQGINYALMRFLIPSLAGYTIEQKGHPDLVFEMVQAGKYAAAYMDYVQKEIFNKAGLPQLQCKAIPYITGKAYSFPNLGGHGDGFGDHTLTCGSGGWVMTTAQMAKFFRQLVYTNNILSQDLIDMMHDNLMGYDGESGTTPGGQGFVIKGGIYFTSTVKLKTTIIGFDNGIQVAMIINSAIKGAPGMKEIIIGAYDDTWKTIHI